MSQIEALIRGNDSVSDILTELMYLEGLVETEYQTDWTLEHSYQDKYPRSRDLFSSMY